MKSADAVLGKRILGVDLKWANSHKGTPSSGLFLVFDDGAYYEFNTQKGYLEIGRHLPKRNPSADPLLANYYLAAAGSVAPDGEPPLPPLLRPRQEKSGD